MTKITIPLKAIPPVSSYPETAEVHDTDDIFIINSGFIKKISVADLKATGGFAPFEKGVTNGDSHDHSGGDGGQIDHGGLAGLSDDDHSQYFNQVRGDARYLLQETGSIRKVVSKTGIVDNSITGIFTITTTNESGSADGGGYTCKIKTLVGHSATAPSSSGAVLYGEWVFQRIMTSGGTGVNSAVAQLTLTSSVASAPTSRDIGTVTVTVTETSEYIQTISFQIDLTGSSVSAAQVTCLIEILHTGFTTPPVVAAA